MFHWFVKDFDGWNSEIVRFPLQFACGLRRLDAKVVM